MMEPIDVYILILGSMIAGIGILALINNRNNKKRRDKNSH